MFQTSCPREDGRDRVGRGRLALLMLTVMPGHRSMSGFGFDGPAVRGHQYRGHQPQRPEALCHGVGLNIAVVVLAGPDVPAFPLQRGRHHVVDEAVLVRDARLLEIFHKLGREDLRKQILEPSVVRLEDGVLRGHVDGVIAGQAVPERRAREVPDGLVEVVHAHGDTTGRKVEHVELHRLGAVRGRESHGQRSGGLDLEVGCPVLITERMAANDDRLGPGGNQSRDVVDDDRLAEDDAAQNVPDSAVRRPPHLLQAELLNSSLIGSDRRALHANSVLLDGMSGIDRDLIVGLIAILDTQVVVLQIDIEVFQDQFVLDELPDDAGHLVAVELDDGVFHLDLGHGFPHRSFTSACLALTASYASTSSAFSLSVKGVSITVRTPSLPSSASTPK